VDIYETPTSFVLTAEVPGVTSSEIDIKVVDNNLILRGERRWEHDVHGETVHRLENAYGRFERTFTLSETIDAERISAQLQCGVLRVELPKHQSSGREIEIETNPSGK
jgi:HSP20 family protein